MFYYTVRFTGHGDKYIVKKKCINLVSDKFCVAKYKGCWYDAEILDSGNNFEILQARKQECVLQTNRIMFYRLIIASTQSSNVKITQPDDASNGSVLNTVLLHQNWFSALQLIIKYRNEAGVDEANLYVFGISEGHMNDNHLLACNLIRNFALDCGAEYPDTSLGTLLRKHIATVVQMLNLTTSDMALLANFLGHDGRGDINKYKGLNLEQICHDTDSFINEPPGNIFKYDNSLKSVTNDGVIRIPNQTSPDKNTTTLSNDDYIPVYDNEIQEHLEVTPKVSPFGKVKNIMDNSGTKNCKE